MKMSASESNMSTCLSRFLFALVASVEEDVRQRVMIALTGVFSGSPATTRGPGRPPKDPSSKIARKPRKRSPKQLCPVPGCKGLAAPIFGMVCSEHKDVAKSKILKYRAARKAAKKIAKKPAKKPAKKLVKKIAKKSAMKIVKKPATKIVKKLAATT